MRTPGASSIVGLVLLAGFVTPAATMAQAETCGGEPVLMLTRGEEPLRELRYAWVVGTTESVTISMDAEIEMSLDGTRMSSMAVGAALDVEESVVDIGEDGIARMELLLRDAHIELDAAAIDGEPVTDEDRAGLAQAMEEVSRSLVGLTGWEIRDSRGDVRSFGFDLPDGVPDTIRQQFDQGLTAPLCLPSQPVGIGATWVWQTSTASIDDGVRVATQIKAIEGDLVTMTQSMSLDTDEIPDEYTETDGTEVISMETTGEGGGLLIADLKRLYGRSETQLDIGTIVVFDVEGTPMTTTMQISTHSRVGPEASPAPG